MIIDLKNTIILNLNLNRSGLLKTNAPVKIKNLINTNILR